MKLNFTIALIFYIAILCLSVNAQNSGNIQNFSGKDFSFSYPSDWKVIDKSVSTMQQLNLVPESGNVLIVVSAYQSKDFPEDAFDFLKLHITQPRMESISKKFSTAKKTSICTDIRDSKIPGLRISGLYGKEETTSDNFSFIMDDTFFNLVYLKENKESSKADFAWETLIKTLEVKGKNSKKNPIEFDSVRGEILNGKAVKLPKPIFPSGVKLHSDERVEVKITIDENGDVISAKAGRYPSDPALQLAAIQAAKGAKFTPTSVCGEVAKISGRIVYKFGRNQ